MTDLDKYYKKVNKCRLCNKEYGTDAKVDNKLCPNCNSGLTTSGWRIKKYEKLLQQNLNSNRTLK